MVKMSMLPKLISPSFNMIPIKIPEIFFFLHIDKLILKCIWKRKGPRMAETVLKKKNKVTGITLPDVRAHYIAIANKTVW